MPGRTLHRYRWPPAIGTVMPSAEFRCYAELNDFLPLPHRQRAFTYTFRVPGSVKDGLESLGVPHPEVDLLLVNGESTAFPRFRRLDVSAVSPVHVPPPAEPRFALDDHLGRLARYLRLLGFDATHQPQADDADLANRATAEDRILLTRDLDLLKRHVVRRGYRVRNTDPRRQAVEVVRYFGLDERLAPFTRCLACGERLLPATPEEVTGRIPPAVATWSTAFHRCPGCARVYWPGSHHRRLSSLVEEVRSAAARPGP
jgi:uncharacterized protein with PIN domain